MKPVLSAEQRGQALAEASRAACLEGVLALRAAGKELAEPDEKTLLAKAVARDHVELELEILAYEQGRRNADGSTSPNRNFVRFRDGAMQRLGRSGKGTPFLRDHNQHDSAAVGGRVLKSETVKADEIGHYQIRQIVRLTEPSAVERVLRGLTNAISIGWRATGPVNCTLCGTEVLSECWHWPGDVLEVDGTSHTVEWEFTEAELVETSEVPIGAVPTAGLEGIRAALSATPSCGAQPQRNDPMKDLRVALAARLGLAGTASDDEIITAVNGLDVDSKELAVVKKELAILQLEAAIDRKTDCDRFVEAALAVGKIKPSDEKIWRDLFELSPDRAKSRMNDRAANLATPVGAERQSAAPEPVEAAKPTGRDEKTKRVLADNGVDHSQAVKYAAAFGAKDPKAAIAKHAAGVEEN